MKWSHQFEFKKFNALWNEINVTTKTKNEIFPLFSVACCRNSICGSSSATATFKRKNGTSTLTVTKGTGKMDRFIFGTGKYYVI